MLRYLAGPLRRAATVALCLAAACGSGTEELDARLQARRAALGLDDGTLTFADAMSRMRAKGYEGLLARVGSKRLRPDDVLDAALEIGSLLARADKETASVRPPDPPGFDSLLARARAKADELARAAAAGRTGEKEAGELLASCVDCHVTFRIPR
jgi:hypothetical protein